MSRIALAGLLVVVALLGLSRPSSASVTAASLSLVGSNPLSVKCPASVQFAGSVAGSPGTVFTYSFNRFVNSVQQVVNGGAVTMPGAGSIAVNDSIPISASTSGSTFDQIWVHNISGGQTDVYSNKANFAVNCQSGGALNGALNAGVIISPLFVPGPTDMGSTHDAKVCGDHGGFGGGLACTAGLPSGMLPLIWNCVNCKVDGYHLYRVDGGQHALQPPSGAYSNDATVTLALLAAPSDGFNGKCYAVTAYKGSNESALSNWACAGAGSTATMTTLSPAHVLHWSRSRESRTGSIGYTHPPYDSYDSGLYVGYADHYGENPFGDLYSDQWNRLGLAFDLSSLAGHPISKAVLKLSALSSWHDYDSTDYVKLLTANLSAQSPTACVTIVDLAADHWWLNNDLSSTVGYLTPGAYMGPDFSIDVTTAVQKWLGLAAPPNFGFVLRGDDENDQWHGNANHVCLTQLQSASLIVTYY